MKAQTICEEGGMFNDRAV